MQHENSRIVRMAVAYRGLDLSTSLKGAQRRAAASGELLLLYVLVSALWGLVLYEALFVIVRP